MFGMYCLSKDVIQIEKEFKIFSLLYLSSTMYFKCLIFVRHNPFSSGRKLRLQVQKFWFENGVCLVCIGCLNVKNLSI